MVRKLTVCVTRTESGVLFTISHLAFNISCRVAQHRDDKAAVTLTVRIMPRASRSEIVGRHDGALRIRIAAPPVEGAANRELIKLLAKTFKVPQNAVTIVSGSNSKNKIVRIENPSSATINELSKFK